jgi:hypothetical protein
MREEKFKDEVFTLKRFFVKYCNDKHINQYNKTYHLNYKQNCIQFNLYLCKECHDTITYSFERLIQCPHEEKPRCRRCTTPCYEKIQWKKLAKIKKYGALKFGLKKVKNKIYDLLPQNL